MTSRGHTYVSDIEHREEGGTPAIVESIRAGLVFGLKQSVGSDRIKALEHDFIERAIGSWSENPNITIMGNPKADRLSILSFVISHAGKTLHYNYVVALLNDLFGIQARGGCSCAGPYGQRLLGIDDEQSDLIEAAVAEGCEVIKPGWVRVNFNYFIPPETFQYIVDAVHLIAAEGWRLLPHYEYEPATAVWRHRDGVPKPAASLVGIDFTSEDDPAGPSTAPITELKRYMDEAQHHPWRNPTRWTTITRPRPDGRTIEMVPQPGRNSLMIEPVQDPTDEQIATWQRTLAPYAYNDTWTLLDLNERTREQEEQMLASTFAQRYHWYQVGACAQLGYRRLAGVEGGGVTRIRRPGAPIRRTGVDRVPGTTTSTRLSPGLPTKRLPGPLPTSTTWKHSLCKSRDGESAAQRDRRFQRA